MARRASIEDDRSISGDESEGQVESQ